ncbi:hypothetical protein EV122DRAFT_218846 [Schizophyllum commune]
MSSWVAHIVQLNNALDSIQRCRLPGSPEEGKQHHIKTAKRLLRSCPLNFLLDEPHDIKVSLPASVDCRKVIIDALTALKSLQIVADDDLSSLWTFDDNVWARALCWLLSLYPIYSLSNALDVFDAMQKPEVETFIGVLDSVTRLSPTDAREALLCNDHHALHLLFALWVRWPISMQNLGMNVYGSISCQNLMYNAWTCFPAVHTEEMFVAPILHMLSDRPKRLSRLCATHLSIRTSAGDIGRAGVVNQVTLRKILTAHCDMGVHGLSGSYIAALVNSLDENLNSASDSHEIWLCVLHALAETCSRSDYAVVFASKYGLLPLLIRVRRLCDDCSKRPVDLSRSNPEVDTTGMVLTLLGDSLLHRRAVKGFRKARSQSATRMPDGPLRVDEQAVVTLGERRYAQLLRADQKWRAVAVCSNPKCPNAHGTPVRSCPCGEFLYCSTHCQRRHWSIGDHRVACEQHVARPDYYTVIPMRAKDAHFLAVIARAYVEENFGTILSRVRGPPSVYEHVRVDLSLTNLREALLDVSTGAKMATLPNPCPYPTFLVHVERMQGDAPQTRVVRLTPRTAPRRVAKEGFRPLMSILYGEFACISYIRTLEFSLDVINRMVRGLSSISPSEEALHLKMVQRILRSRPLHIVLASPPDIPFEAYARTVAGKTMLSADALHTIVAMWLRWPELVSTHKLVPDAVAWSPCVLRAAWQVFDPQVANDLIGTQILRLAGGSVKSVFRACGAHLRALSSTGALVRHGGELGWHAVFISTILHHYDFNPQTIPSSFIASVVTVLSDILAAAPEEHDNWVQILTLLFRLCTCSDHATMLAIKHGIFPLVVRVRSICSHCSTGTPPSGEGFPYTGGTTGTLTSFIRDSFWSRRAVMDFHLAQVKYAMCMPATRLRADEQTVLNIAKSRYELLMQAEKEWPSVAKCCNPQCPSTGVTTLRSCPCGEALYCSKDCQRAHWDTKEHRFSCEEHFATLLAESTSRVVKAKDVHFLVVIARAFVEANYRRILAALDRPPSASDVVFVGLPLFHDPEASEDFQIKLAPTGLAPDLCPYPSVVVQVAYQQTDGMHKCMIFLVPSMAPWRYSVDEFRPLTSTFYGECLTVASYDARLKDPYQIRRRVGS